MNGSGAGSDLEHLNLSISISSTCFSGLQRLEKLVLGGGSISPTFCFNFPALLYFILVYLIFLFRFSLIFKLIFVSSLFFKFLYFFKFFQRLFF